MPTLTVVLAHFTRWFRLGWIDSPNDVSRKSLPPPATDADIDAELDRMFGVFHEGHPASWGTHQKPSK
jgi:hypothetical protein